MIQRFFFLLLWLVGSALSAFATSEEIIQRHLNAAPGGKLVIDVDFGTIAIVGGAVDDTVAIDAQRTVEISDKSREKEFVEAAPITITQDNNVITIRARSNRKWTWPGNTRMDAHYSVQVPKRFNAELHTGGGAIEVSEISGELHANSGGGKLKFTRIQGPTNADTAGGAVALKECDGTVKIQTNGGRIESIGGKGSLDLHTSGGQVSIRDFAGPVNAASNGGQFTLNNIAGPLNARTAGGAIHATLSNVTDVKLETNAGAIAVAIPANGGFNIDAQSAIGEVTTDLPVTGATKSRHTLHAELNGGGKPLFLRTGAGSISITASDERRAAR